MVRVLGVVLLALVTVFAPVSVHADTLSSTQIITITAVVTPARSIIVNQHGDITMIYSNTNQAVTPTVYADSLAGQRLPLSQQLRDTYAGLIAGRSSMAGVAIPIAQPSGLLKLLSKTISTATLSLKLPKI